MPTTLYLPKNGISVDSANREMLYLARPDGSIASLHVTAVLPPGRVEQINREKGSAMAAIDEAKRVLQTQYNLNVNALPAVNKADLEQQLIRAGKVRNGSPIMDPAPIQEFVQAQPDTLQPVMVNTDPAIQGYRNPNAVNPQTGGYQARPANYNPNATMQAPGTMASTFNQPGIASALGSTTGGTALQSILSNPSLTPDQKTMIQALFSAVSTNDQNKAEQIKAAIAAATQYSDPYFKAQTRLAIDALDRAFQAADDDLAYKETKLRTSLEDLRKDIASSKDYLSFQEQTELKDLMRRQEQDLEQTAEQMAAAGFTSSSIRSKKEGLIHDTYGDLRESSRRSFLFKGDQLANQEQRGIRDTSMEVARIQQLAQQGKLDALRQTEEKVGSAALNRSGGLGNIGGTIPRQQAQDAFGFASSFVF